MAATASFRLDFTQWDASLKAAQANMKDFEKVGANAARQFAQLARSFSGQQIQKEAKAAAAAVEAIGGVTKLTAAEQRKLSATVTEAIAKYKALGQTAPDALSKIDAELKQLAKDQAAATTATSNVTGNFGKTVAAYAAGLATFQTAKSVIEGTVGAIVDFARESVTSFAAAEAAQKKMVVALRAQGQETPEVIDQYNELASTIQKTTAFSDDAASEMQALFITIGNVGPAQMEKATTAATDLAAGLGLDLTSAATLVAKALEGNIGALSRYGIQLDKARVEAEGADYIFGKIQERFGGQAQAQLETYSGQLQQLANDWDNVKEAIGKALVTNDLTVFALRNVRAAMNETSDAAEDVTLSVGDMWQGLGGDPIIGTAIDLLTAYVGLLNEADRTAKGIGAKPLALPLPPTLPKIDASDAIEEWDRAREAAKKAADEIARLRDEITGAKTIASIKQMAAAWNGLTASQKASAPVTAALAKFYDGLPKDLREIPPALRAVVAAGEDASRSVGELAEEYQNVREEVSKLDERLDQLQLAADAEEARQELADIVADLAQVGNKIDEAFDIREQTDETIADIRGVDNAIQTMFEKAEQAAKTVRWPDILRRHIEDSLGNVADIIVDGLIHGADFEQVATAIGSEIGSGIGGAIGEALGGPIGGKIGEAFGALLGPLIDKIIVTRAEQTQRKIRNEYGVAISEGLAQAIEDAAADFGGDRQAAKLFNLDRIIAEGGGLSQKNIDLMLARLHDVFSAIEDGRFTTEQAMQVLDKNFANFAEFVTRDGALASKALLEIIHLNDQFGTSSAAVAEFVTKQLSGALGGLTTFLQNAKVTSQEAADGIAASIFGIFEELQKQGATPLEAIKQITPVLEQLDAQLKAAGFSGGAAFDQIRALAALASDEVKGPMIEAIAGLDQALQGLHNSGVLNQEMFAGLAAQVTDTYNRLIAQGADGDKALQLIAPTLQTLYELQKDFGYQVDAATQKLIDQGIEAGKVGEEHRSAQEKMAIALDRTADAVEYLAEQFGYVADEAAKSAEEINKIPKNINIKVHYKSGDLPDPGGTQTFAHGGAVYAQQGLFVPRGTDTVPAMLTPGEVVLPTDLVGALRRAVSGQSSAAPVTVHLTIQAMDGADVDRVVRSPAFRQALTSAVTSNTGGYRTDLRDAIGVR